MQIGDWKEALAAARPMILAVVTAIGAAGTVLTQGGSTQSAVGAAFISFCAVYLEILRRQNDDAKAATAKTNTLINGRVDELLASAFARGKAEGIATVSKIVGDSPAVGMEGRVIAAAVVEASKSSPDVLARSTKP